ncbi:hypothetical protein, variant [Aphanomyces astaci]|nr:hypothetical protein, variant [Aphanomyces astaci]ETV69696.1 hypothetical protein, variant [Aphanomyces astaci]|eukprot:XP_009840709.1 hypothetical protein, variant [Aphanomyces astaci]
MLFGVQRQAGCLLRHRLGLRSIASLRPPTTNALVTGPRPSHGQSSPAGRRLQLVAGLALTMALADERSQAKARGDLPMTRNSIADAVEKAAPGVVNITIYSHHQPTSSGSGFLIDPSGLVVTNAHVVAHVSRHSSITVTLENGQKYEATVHSFDTKADLALVQLNDPPATKLPTVAIGTSSSVRAGEWVIALGSPLSLQNSVSAGIISATARRGSELGFAPSHRTEFLQTDAAINVGNSGGPLVNLDGQVIGINTMKVAGGISGISFAIPIDGGMQVINQLRQHRTVTRPYVGMQMVEFGGTILPDIAK